jgi:hypothetical protein
MTRVVNDGLDGIQVAEQAASNTWVRQRLPAESQERADQRNAGPR